MCGRFGVFPHPIGDCLLRCFLDGRFGRRDFNLCGRFGFALKPFGNFRLRLALDDRFGSRRFGLCGFLRFGSGVFLTCGFLHPFGDIFAALFGGGEQFFGFRALFRREGFEPCEGFVLLFGFRAQVIGGCGGNRFTGCFLFRRGALQPVRQRFVLDRRSGVLLGERAEKFFEFGIGRRAVVQSCFLFCDFRFGRRHRFYPVGQIGLGNFAFCPFRLVQIVEGIECGRRLLRCPAGFRPAGGFHPFGDFLAASFALWTEFAWLRLCGRGRGEFILAANSHRAAPVRS